MKTELQKELARIRRTLVRFVLKSVNDSALPFYGCGYVDHLEPDGKLKLKQLPKPLILRFPLRTGDEDEAGRVTIEHLTRKGFISDSYGGGAVTTEWQDMALENLAEIARVLPEALQS